MPEIAKSLEYFMARSTTDKKLFDVYLKETDEVASLIKDSLSFDDASAMVNTLNEPMKEEA